MLSRVLDRPRLATIETARQQMLFRQVAVDVVALAQVFVVTAAESNEDFVVPGPKAMVRRPAAEAARHVEDFHVTKRREGCFENAQRTPRLLLIQVRLDRITTPD